MAQSELWPILAGLHTMLLRLAGRIPDAALTRFRNLLAEVELAPLAEQVASFVIQHQVALPAEEIALLTRVTRVFDIGALRDPAEKYARILVSETVPEPAYTFRPVLPSVLAVANDRIPAQLDLTRPLPPELADLQHKLTDMPAQYAAVTLQVEGALAVWTAWRFAGTAESATRVVVAVVPPGAEAWQLAGETIRELEKWNAPATQVEVYWADQPVLPYQRAARDGSALIWAADPADAQARTAAAAAKAAAPEPPVDEGLRALNLARAKAEWLDYEGLHAMFDWSLTMARRFALLLPQAIRAPGGVEKTHELREAYEAAQRDPKVVDRHLKQIVAVLGHTTKIERASESARAMWLERFALHPLPTNTPGIEELHELRRRVEALTDIYEVTARDGTVMPFAWAPDTHKLVAAY
jgi:hypothetical protein